MIENEEVIEQDTEVNNKSNKYEKLGIVLVIAIFIFIISYFVISNFNSYTVTFDSDNGQEVQTVKVVQNHKLSKPKKDPVKDGYTFKGWYKNGKKYDFNSVVKSNFVLTAFYSELGSNENSNISTR